jgi:DNA-binding NtrC family response regulator
VSSAVLVVDDEKNILVTLSRALKLEGFEVDVAGSGQIALEKAKQRAYDVVLLDVNMPDLDGLEVLRQLKAERDDLPVVMMSGQGQIATAVLATRHGADDFLEKPIGSERLLVSLRAALERASLRAENRDLRSLAALDRPLVGESAAMEELRAKITRAASAHAPVLILGERGTGKELVARAIHQLSPRKHGPLEKLNAAAVPAELVESELFGHEAGAFTGATRQRKGKFERAHRGTLFLDEVGDMPSAMQAKLLRVLQEGELERVGGSDLIRVDVRVVAATNRDLSEAIASGAFRSDLFDRLNVLPLRVPPLRERRDDVPLLAQRFLVDSARLNDRPKKHLSTGALAQLERYDYPGNVRELSNLIERLVILSPHDEIRAEDARELLPLGNAPGGEPAYSPERPLRDMLEDAERALVKAALAHHRGNVTATADALGLERSHLYKKMRALGLR